MNTRFRSAREEPEHGGPNLLRPGAVKIHISRGPASRQLQQEQQQQPHPAHFTDWDIDRRNIDDLFSSMSRNDRWNEMESQALKRNQEWRERTRQLEEQFFGPLWDRAPAFSRFDDKMSRPFGSNYERKDDGNVYYVARFDVPNANLTDLEVTVKDARLYISAKSEYRSGGTSHFSEFRRDIDLPRNVVEEGVTASVVGNELVVECPMMSPPFEDAPSHQLTSHKTPASAYTHSNSSSHFSSDNWSRPSHSSLSHGLSTSLSNQAIHPPVRDSLGVIHGRDFNLTVEVPDDFNSEDLHIETKDGMLFVSASRNDDSMNKKSSKWFNKQFSLPTHIDPDSVRAEYKDGILTISGEPYLNRN